MGHINPFFKAEEVVVKPDVDVRNWRNAGKYRLHPVRPSDWNKRPTPPIPNPPPSNPFPPESGFSNYGFVKSWFIDSPDYSSYGDSVWDTVNNYGEVKTP